jgi:hypothetical protein
VLTGTKPGLYNIKVIGNGGARTGNNNDMGIFVDNATGYVIENCFVTNTTAAGIFTNFGTGGEILHNVVQSTNADGIMQTEDTTNLEIAYNQTITTGDDGISITSYNDGEPQSGNIIVHDNSVIGNTVSRSITVNGGTNIKIYNNHVDGGTAGISVGATTEWGSLQDSNVTVYNNTIKNTTFTGEGTIGGGAIHLYNNESGTDTGIVYYDNQVSNYAHYGIFVWGTNQIQAIYITTHIIRPIRFSIMPTRGQPT